MDRGSFRFSPAFRVASIAVLTAVTAVFTLLIRVPSPARGYFNLGDVAIVFAAVTFGPFTAAIAGGLGTALADVIGSFVQWAPITLVVHGLQGLIIGLIVRLRPSSVPLAVAAGVAGAAVMAAGYLAGGTLLEGFGPALAELPGNAIQSGAGIVVGIPLWLAVRKAFPPVRDYAW
jgi:uncharacterized membrane protein